MSTKKLIKALGLIIVVALLAAALPQQAKAQEGTQTLNVAQWTGPTDTGLDGRETVLFDGTYYHMWYSSTDEKTLYHVSSDNPASFTAGTEVTFTGGTPIEVGSVSVVKEDAAFYMVAYGPSNKTSFAIYTSENGTAWNYNSVIFDGTDKFTGLQKIDGPFLLKTESGFRLYFQVGTGADYASRTYDIYVAESSTITGQYNLGTTNPVLTNGATGTWDANDVMHPWVVKDSGTYYMWYSGFGGTGNPQKVGMAKSADGYNWVKSPANPIFAPATGYAEPSVITDGDTWQMWTMGTGSVINYLTATGPFEFQSIQDAIDAASAGDTINVAAGTYVENVTTTNKPLNFVGIPDADGELPVIEGTLTIDSSLYASADSMTIDSLSFSAAGDYDSIVLKKVDGVTIKNSTFDGNNKFMTFVNGGRAVQMYPAPNDHVTIDNCSFKDGYYVTINGYVNNLTVKNSTLTNVKSGVNVQGPAGNTVTIYNTDFSVIAQGEDNDTYGVRFASGGTTASGGNLTITDSSFVVDKNNLVAQPGTYHSAIIIRSGATGTITVEDNQIFGEVVNQATPELDTSPNWWGAQTGPAEGTVVGSVKVNPWCYNAECTELFVAAGGSIQDAIDAAPEGGVVHVGVGTYDEENILITKGITLQGAGAANTFIAPSITTNNSTIVVRNPSGDVTIDGFNFVMKPKVNYGSAVVVTGETIVIDSATVTISNNVVTGSNDGTKSDYGFYGQGNNAKIIIKNNTINKTGDNPIVMEQQFGSTTVENNTIYITDSPDYDAYYSMIYNNETVNTPQIVQNNVFHLDHASTGYSQAISFTTAVLNAWGGKPGDIGHYTNIQVLNNTIYTEGPRARGIGLNDRSAVLGNGTITGSVVTGNKIIGEAATDAETYGITLRGDIQEAVIQNNEISNVNVGFKVQKNSDSGETLICSSGTDFSLNKVTSVTIAAQNTDCADVTVDASPNWWGSYTGPNPNSILGNVTYEPWCGDETCTTFNPVFLPEETTEEDIQEAINVATPGTIIVIPDGEFHQPDGFIIDQPGITIRLSDGTVIQNSSPCFVVTEDNVTITSETLGGGKCVPTDTGGIGDHGIVVNDGVQGLRVVGIEIDGTDQITGDGIHFNGAITNFQILNNYIHDLDGDGVFFTVQPTGEPMEIQGNLFMNNTGLGVNNSAGTANINAEYNSWGDIDGPEAGDGISTHVVADPWTHVDLYMASTTHPLWPDKVAKHQQISYTVYGNFQNVMGADFVLKYPKTLLACLGCTGPTPTNPDPAGAFETETITVDAEAGTIHYVGYNAETETDPLSGAAVALFTVTFEANDDGTGTLDLVETSDLFSMAPPAGPSNNIYAAALADGSVTVIDIFDVTGIFSMQGRVFRGDIPVTLTSTTVGFPYGPFEASSLDVLGINWSVTSLPAGGYLITTNQPRYLNITADLNKQFTLSITDHTLPALELKGGNAYWKTLDEEGDWTGEYDNTVDLADASLVGDQYSGPGEDVVGNNGDVNFDGTVNIFDLAMVGGNYELTSAGAYTSWNPQPED